MNAPTEAQRRTILNHVLTVVDCKFMGAEPDSGGLRERHEQNVVGAQTKVDFDDARARLMSFTRNRAAFVRCELERGARSGCESVVAASGAY